MTCVPILEAHKTFDRRDAELGVYVKKLFCRHRPGEPIVSAYIGKQTSAADRAKTREGGSAHTTLAQSPDEVKAIDVWLAWQLVPAAKRVASQP